MSLPRVSLHRQIALLSLPLVLSNISTPLLGLVDTAILGHLDDPQLLAACALGSTMVTMIAWAFGFLRMGASGQTAQAFGAVDHHGLRKLLWQSCFIALSFALVILLIQSHLADILFYFASEQQQVKPLAREYFLIRIWAVPATFINYALLGWFLGVQRARAPLIIMLVINCLNMLLDYVLVWQLGYGVAGAAWASLVAEYAGLIVAAGLVHRQLARLNYHALSYGSFGLAALKPLLNVNANIFLRTLALELVFFIFASQGSHYGVATLAANAVLLNFLLLISNGLDAVAHAAEALAGAAKGKQSLSLFDRIIKATGIWTLACSLVFAAVFWGFGRHIIAMLTDLAEVRQLAGVYLPYVMALPLLAGASYWLDGVFIAVSRSRDMRNIMLLASLAGFVPLWWLLTPWLNHGLWIAFISFMALRSALMAWRFVGLRRKQMLM